MAITVNSIVETNRGSVMSNIVNVSLDNSYPTGGYALGSSQTGINPIQAVIVCGGNTAAAGYIFWWNTQTSSLEVFESPAVASTPSSAVALSQVAAATNLSALTLTLEVIGY